LLCADHSLLSIFRLDFYSCLLKEEFEDTKGVIRLRVSKKNQQHNGQKKKDKQRSTKHTHKTKDRVTRTSLKTGDELRCSGKVRSSCFTSGICRVNLVTNPVISHEWGKDREVCTTSGTYPWLFMTQIFHNLVDPEIKHDLVTSRLLMAAWKILTPDFPSFLVFWSYGRNF